MKKICCFFNYPSHYRYSIYKKIEDNFDVDFFFGDRLSFNLKRFDVTRLNNFKSYFKSFYFKSIIYNRGLLSKFIFSKYKYFVFTGEIKNISIWLCLLMSVFSSKKIILWTHGWYGDETALKSFIKKVYYKLSYKVLLYGDYAEEIMIEKGISPNKLKVIYNSLDYDYQLKIRKELKTTNIFLNFFKNNNPVLCYVGRIQGSKKIEILIEALEKLKSENINLNLVVIGGGSDLSLLKELSIKFGLQDQIWFYGPCYNEKEIGELLFNSFLCVSPGNVGLTAIHAQMYGTPIATHNNRCNQGPEFESIKEGETGFFFEENDINDLCVKIANWLNNKMVKRESVRLKCFSVVDAKYNPYYQINVLKSILGENYSNK